jgi:hypothetical protein
MREPCLSNRKTTITCSLSLDVSRPVLPLKGTHGLPTCSIELMPWSPFPCTYDTSRYNGTPGQHVDFCTDQLNAGGQFLTSFPPYPRSCYPSNYQRTINKLLIKQASITVHFKAAQGHQFDRTYSMYITDSVVRGTACVSRVQADSLMPLSLQSTIYFKSLSFIGQYDQVQR